MRFNGPFGRAQLMSCLLVRPVSRSTHEYLQFARVNVVVISDSGINGRPFHRKKCYLAQFIRSSRDYR